MVLALSSWIKDFRLWACSWVNRLFEEVRHYFSTAPQAFEVYLAFSKSVSSLFANPWWLSRILCGHTNASIEHSKRRLFLLMIVSKNVRFLLIRGTHSFLVNHVVIVLRVCSLCHGIAAHLSIHQVINKPLASVQIRSKIIAYLDQSVSFLLKSSYLTVFGRNSAL